MILRYTVGCTKTHMNIIWGHRVFLGLLLSRLLLLIQTDPEPLGGSFCCGPDVVISTAQFLVIGLLKGTFSVFVVFTECLFFASVGFIFDLLFFHFLQQRSDQMPSKYNQSFKAMSALSLSSRKSLSSECFSRHEAVETD